MDREQEEIKFLGFFGIIKESIKIIFTWREIFSQITLALVLPLSFIVLAYSGISDFLVPGILLHQGAHHDWLSYLEIIDIIVICLSAVFYYVLVLIFSLLSISTIADTIACVCTSRSITFERVMSVVPKVWKKLMITLLWSFLAVFIYIVYVIMTILIYYLLFDLIRSPAIGLTLGLIILILFVFALVYIGIILDLAGVITVLEDIHGVQAMFKSMNLIKRKMGISIAINLLLMIGSMAIHTVFNIFLAINDGSGILTVGVPILCFSFLLKLTLFSLVVQIVIYAVCMSYHDDNIKKSTHFLSEYVPLQADDLKLEQTDV